MPKMNHEPGGDDVLAAVQTVYGNGTITEDILYEESYYTDMGEELRQALSSLPGVTLRYDRPPEGNYYGNEDEGDEESGEEAEAEVEGDESASFDLLFLTPSGSEFELEGEMEEEIETEEGDEVETQTVATQGYIGCAVAISSLAPFAVVRFDQMYWTEDGSHTLPDIDAMFLEEEGWEADDLADFQEMCGESGVAKLNALQKDIEAVLRRFNVRVLSDAELARIVPGLQPDPESLMFAELEEVTVQQALFFRGF